MAKKTVEISFDGMKKSFHAAGLWLKEYFAHIDTYGMIAVGAIGAGFVLVIVGIIML